MSMTLSESAVLKIALRGRKYIPTVV